MSKHVHLTDDDDDDDVSLVLMVEDGEVQPPGRHQCGLLVAVVLS